MPYDYVKMSIVDIFVDDDIEISEEQLKIVRGKINEYADKLFANLLCEANKSVTLPIEQKDFQIWNQTLV